MHRRTPAPPDAQLDAQPYPQPDLRPARGRRLAPTVVAVALTATAVGAGGLAAPASAASGASSVTLFPSNSLTVADAAQRTGRRVALPKAGCSGVTTCGLVDRLNTLDGFDLDPRLALHFDAPVDVAAVIASTSLNALSGDKGAVGINRVVYDGATNTVYAHPKQQLREGTTYKLAVSGVLGLPAASDTFTTLSATDGLVDLRGQLDSGKAFADAGIPAAARGLKIDATVPLEGTTFGYVQDQGSEGGLVSTSVPVVPGASGSVVFGSYLAPNWLGSDRTIRQVPTDRPAPSALGRTRLPFVLVLPAGPAPVGGWPTAVFGHGFTRTAADVLLAATYNNNTGVATIGTDVVGHGYGPRSTWTYTRAGVTRSVPAHGRGIDLDGNGVIGSTEGSSTLATGAAAAVSSRDGLRQTVLDNGTLVRAVARGLDVKGTSASELRTSGVSYFGQSFGGIYGTMLAGADPTVSRAALNVAGGPITEIARLAPVFRPLIAQSLQIAGLLNSNDPSRYYFEESLPLRGQSPVLSPAPGALPIQDYLAQTTWLDRPGSPEAYAPLIRPERTIFQVAFGDQTVPNPTAYTVLAAGGLFGRTTLYRNDRTESASKNPHGFLLDPVNFLFPFFGAQNQIHDFLQTGKVIDPDGDADVFLVPLPHPAVLLDLNFAAPAPAGAAAATAAGTASPAQDLSVS